MGISKSILSKLNILKKRKEEIEQKIEVSSGSSSENKFSEENIDEKAMNIAGKIKDCLNGYCKKLNYEGEVPDINEENREKVKEFMEALCCRYSNVDIIVKNVEEIEDKISNEKIHYYGGLYKGNKQYSGLADVLTNGQRATKERGYLVPLLLVQNAAKFFTQMKSLSDEQISNKQFDKQFEEIKDVCRVKSIRKGDDKWTKEDGKIDKFKEKVIDYKKKLSKQKKENMLPELAECIVSSISNNDDVIAMNDMCNSFRADMDKKLKTEPFHVELEGLYGKQSACLINYKKCIEEIKVQCKLKEDEKENKAQCKPKKDEKENKGKDDIYWFLKYLDMAQETFSSSRKDIKSNYMDAKEYSKEKLKLFIKWSGGKDGLTYGIKIMGNELGGKLKKVVNKNVKKMEKITENAKEVLSEYEKIEKKMSEK